MIVFVAGIVKEVDTVILENEAQDDEGTSLSVLAKRIVLDNNNAYLTTGSIDVEIGQQVCFSLKEGQDRIIQSIKKHEIDSLKNNLIKKSNKETRDWRTAILCSLGLMAASSWLVNDSYHRYLSSHDPMFNTFFCFFCLFICISMVMLVFSFSEWKKSKKKDFLSSEDNETLEKFKSSLLKESETEAINIEIKEVHHV